MSDPGRPRLLQHYLESAAVKWPDRTAVVDGTSIITFSDLHARGGQLAAQLLESGLSPRDIVGVYLPKSINAIASFHGVVMAGGAYVPLDVHFSPPARIRRILRLGEIRFLITDPDHWRALTQTADGDEALRLRQMTVLIVDSLAAGDGFASVAYAEGKPVGETGTSPGTTDLGIHPDDLAYVLYTSGSTGEPKGVMISHRNAITFIDWALNCFQTSETDRFSSHAPFHFDLSVFDLYVSIASGAQVHLVPPSQSANPRALLAWIRFNAISIWYSVPSVWTAIMSFATPTPADLASLVKVLFAGEPFPPRALRQLMDLVPAAEYYNLYGPTETNVCTFHKVTPSTYIGDTAVPIGRACSGTEIVVLNAGEQPVGVGEEGELFVLGPIVTRGYYRDPDRTERAFRPSPVPEHHAAPMYRTGDIVRRLDDDTFAFVGRRDLMVKCSGFRIELQEVEHVLQQHPRVLEAVVAPRYHDRRGSCSLCAFVSAKGSSDTRVIDLRKYCSERMPSYMVPETIEIVDAIPKNANGKVDRACVAEWVGVDAGDES